eukprot:scaffold35036_cov36-Cyclotella_meneghiniana.AAC.1
MQQQLQQLQQQQQPAGGGAQATVTFSTTPGTSNQANIIDYGTRYGMALYDMGTKPLFDSEEDKFDLDNDESLNFEKAVERRARAMGWYHAQQGILTFTVDGESLDLVTDYGRIDIGEIKTQSEPIYLATGALKNQRAAQNNDMMHTMLLDSLTKAAKARVQVFKDEYEFGDGGTPEVKVIVAAALYKIIMRLTIIALEALLDKNLKLTKDLQQKLKQKGDKDGQKEDGGGKATKTKNKKNIANKTRQKEDEAWKKVAPKDNEPKSKQIGKKTWNWCMHHQAWCIHKSSDCKLGKKQQESKPRWPTAQSPNSKQATTRQHKSILPTQLCLRKLLLSLNDGSDPHGS